MAFRDDREALRAKNEVLEGEVEGLRRDFERAQCELEAHEARGEQGDEELARLRQQVADYRRRLGLPDERAPHPPSRRGRIPVRAMAYALGVPTLALMFAMGSQLTRPRRDLRTMAHRLAARRAPPPAPRIAPVHFGAEVVWSEGLGLEPGDGCIITANLSPSAAVERVRVTCDQLVYDSRVGGARASAHVLEYHTPDGVFSYLLRLSDIGSRSGPQPRASIDTRERFAHIWSEEGEPFALRLYVSDRSAPRVGGRSISRVPLRAGTDAQFHVRARVQSSRGPHPDVGEVCELRGHTDTGMSCRFVIRCGETILYGAEASGYNQWCRGSGGLERFQAVDDLAVSSEDGDPRVLWQLPHRRVLVEDGPADARWQVELALEEDPRCDLEGRWTGWLTTAHGESSMSMRAAGPGEPPVVTTSRGIDVGKVVELDCVRGEAAFLASSGARYEGRFGPGFATFIGHVAGAAEGTFALRRER